jgi:hypothetical protein
MRWLVALSKGNCNIMNIKNLVILNCLILKFHRNSSVTLSVYHLLVMHT